MGELIIGHLVGDFLVQNDWMAQEKTRNSAVAAIHAAAYTASVLLFSPRELWDSNLLILFAAGVFLTHWAVDRFRLPVYYMRLIGQEAFLEKLGPWSFIVVDSTFHLVTLYLSWRLCS